MAEYTTSGFSPGKLDSAETFGESDVSLSHSTTTVSNESIQIANQSSEIDYATSSWQAVDTEGGAVVSVSEQIESIEVETDVSYGGPGELRVADHSDGTVIATGNTMNDGETQSLDVSLSAGNDYRIYLYNSSGFDSSFSDDSAHGALPVTSQYFDITAGWFDGNTDPDEWRTFTRITMFPPSTSGSVTIEWPYPSDMYSWDKATFTAAVDDESVEVYIEEDQAGGWTEVAGPLDRGDEIPADPDNNMRYRVDITRGDTSNNPTLDSIYRRYTV